MNEEAMRNAFEAWAASEYGANAWRHTGSTSGEWQAWQAATRAAVPDGWKVVPVEPTPEMLAGAAVASTELLIHGGPPRPDHRDPLTIELNAAAVSYKAALAAAPVVQP